MSLKRLGNGERVTVKDVGQYEWVSTVEQYYEQIMDFLN